MNGVKRGLPVPGAKNSIVEQRDRVYSQKRNTAEKPETKRKLLSESAGEFSTKSTASQPTSRNIRGTALKDAVSGISFVYSISHQDLSRGILRYIFSLFLHGGRLHTVT